MSILERSVTVCNHCHRARCWLGVLPCHEAQYAGTKQMTVLELRNLGYENPQYWFKDPSTGAIDSHAMAEYEAVA